MDYIQEIVSNARLTRKRITSYESASAILSKFSSLSVNIFIGTVNLLRLYSMCILHCYPC